MTDLDEPTSAWLRAQIAVVVLDSRLATPSTSREEFLSWLPGPAAKLAGDHEQPLAGLLLEVIDVACSLARLAGPVAGLTASAVLDEAAQRIAPRPDVSW